MFRLGSGMDTEAIEISKAPRRNEVLAILVDRIMRTRICPSYEEIGRAMIPPVGKSRVQQLIDQLVKQGAITREPGSRRAVQLCDDASCRDALDGAMLEISRPSALERLPYLPLIVTAS